MKIEALDGRSRQRNRAIAKVFNQMGLIEAWGNGLKSIQKAAKEYDLAEPAFMDMPETENQRVSAAQIAKRLSITQRTVERYIKELREEGKLVRHGSARGGYWEVVR